MSFKPPSAGRMPVIAILALQKLPRRRSRRQWVGDAANAVITTLQPGECPVPGESTDFLLLRKGSHQEVG